MPSLPFDSTVSLRSEARRRISNGPPRDQHLLGLLGGASPYKYCSSAAFGASSCVISNAATLGWRSDVHHRGSNDHALIVNSGSAVGIFRVWLMANTSAQYEKRPTAAFLQSVVTPPAPSRTGRSREALANPLKRRQRPVFSRDAIHLRIHAPFVTFTVLKAMGKRAAARPHLLGKNSSSPQTHGLPRRTNTYCNAQEGYPYMVQAPIEVSPQPTNRWN